MPDARLRISFPALLLVLAGSGLDAQVVLSPVRYELGVALDFDAEILRGTAGIEVRNPSARPVRQVSLLLYRLLRVTAVRDSRGRELRFSQSVVAFRDFGPLQVNQIVVTLGQPLAPKAQTGIQVRYEGYLLGYAETGMRYVQDRIDSAFTILRPDSYAYPSPGYPSMAINRGAPLRDFTYSARITVPKGFTVANGGRLEGIDTAGSQVTFRFTSLKPSGRMDFAIAKYTELSSGPIRVYHLPGDSLGAAGVAEAAQKALDLYSNWFGPLAEATGLTFIEIPDGWGSQADVTAIIQSAAAFRDPKQHREVYHEISHLWNAPDTDRPSPRWNEGLATFLEYLVTQETTGKPEVDAEANSLLDWLRGALPTHEAWSRVPLVDYGRAGMTDLSYSVAAVYFDLLYRLAGRETFNRIIGGYYAAFHTRGGGVRDFAEVLRKTATMDLSQLNNDWLFTPAWADRVEHSATIEDLEAYYRRGAPGER
jgi:hypothetical protein